MSTIEGRKSAGFLLLASCFTGGGLLVEENIDEAYIGVGTLERY